MKRIYQAAKKQTRGLTLEGLEVRIVAIQCTYCQPMALKVFNGAFLDF